MDISKEYRACYCDDRTEYDEVSKTCVEPEVPECEYPGYLHYDGSCLTYDECVYELGWDTDHVYPETNGGDY